MSDVTYIISDSFNETLDLNVYLENSQFFDIVVPIQETQDLMYVITKSNDLEFIYEV